MEDRTPLTQRMNAGAPRGQDPELVPAPPRPIPFAFDGLTPPTSKDLLPNTPQPTALLRRSRAPVSQHPTSSSSSSRSTKSKRSKKAKAKMPLGLASSSSRPGSAFQSPCTGSKRRRGPRSQSENAGGPRKFARRAGDCSISSQYQAAERRSEALMVVYDPTKEDDWELTPPIVPPPRSFVVPTDVPQTHPTEEVLNPKTLTTAVPASERYQDSIERNPGNGDGRANGFWSYFPDGRFVFVASNIPGQGPPIESDNESRDSMSTIGRYGG